MLPISTGEQKREVLNSLRALPERIFRYTRWEKRKNIIHEENTLAQLFPTWALWIAPKH